MSNQPQSQSDNAELTAEDVVAFLRTHPDFFTEHDYLLKELRLPHDSGKAISLVQRQLTMFREQRDHYQSQLVDLVDTARENGRHFEKSRRLLMNLLDADSVDEVQVVLQESFSNDFKVDFCNLILAANSEDSLQCNVTVVSEEAIEACLGSDLPGLNKAHCGQLSRAQNELIFGTQQAEQVKSTAVIPVKEGDLLAVLSIGSKDPDYFHGNLDSVFLAYISESLAKILPALIAKESAIVSPT